MSGPTFLAGVGATNRIFGLGVGDNVEEFKSRLTVEFYEELCGRSGSRQLRRDYGALEASFSEAASWSCTRLLVEVQRLASNADLLHEISSIAEVDVDRYTSWQDVQVAVETLFGPRRYRSKEEGAFIRYIDVDSGVTVHVVADADQGRSERPGHGDIWSIDLA